MIPAEFIRLKRDGAALPPEDLTRFIADYVAGRIPDYQVSALLMAIFFNGMTARETAALARAMMESGHTYSFEGIDRPVIDKHSTGGVGDKVSLVLAPLAAACGLAVPMVSGRGLGHTGGTLDKLEAIPGFRIGLPEADFIKQVRDLGVAMIGQSDDFVPADKRLYALRDVTATVESVPLICASILSKKAASGARGIVMDVKCGTGAFMNNLDAARELADGLIETGESLDLPVKAVLTAMDVPLGREIGNALETREAIECLRGGGPMDLRMLCVELVSDMVLLGQLELDEVAARRRTLDALESGRALQLFAKMVERQGGDARVTDDPHLLAVAPHRVDYPAETAGVLNVIDCRELGLAALVLGAGRRSAEDSVDHAVGLTMLVNAGDTVEKGQPLVAIHCRDESRLDECRRHLSRALSVDESAKDRLPLIVERRGS